MEGDAARVPLDEALVALEEHGLDVIAFHEALGRLDQARPRQAQVVILCFSGELSVAESLEVSVTKVENDWRFARARLKGRLGDSER